MTDKDLEAFERWSDQERGKILPHEENHIISVSPKTLRTWERQAWQAAIEYKQKEIDELIMEKDFHAETLIELKSKIKELETFIRADAISTNWENKEYQEAVHYNWLDDEIRRVEHHNFNLQAENKKLRAALEFYANRNNWKFQSYSSDCKEVIDYNDLGCRSYTDEADFACSSGGRRAREALKK